jgi:pimeloyl-ACP methyl ester carboxylesterase
VCPEHDRQVPDASFHHARISARNRAIDWPGPWHTRDTVDDRGAAASGGAVIGTPIAPDLSPDRPANGPRAAPTRTSGVRNRLQTDPEEMAMSAKRAAPVLFRLACLAGLLSLAFPAKGPALPEARRAGNGPSLHEARSQDGTRIAYDKQGKGPAVIVVNGALSQRSDNAELAQLLAGHLTVYSPDRRGRGDSGDTPPYSVQREIEDIEALIDHAGGSAYVYGQSSGASLALQAASALGDKVRKLALYEPPYSEAEGAARKWREFRATLDGLLAADRRADAVTLFMKFVGAPDDAVAQMKASPAWPGLLAMAPTLAYDNAVVGDDRSVPVGIAAKVKALTLVMDGGASSETMPFMRPTADKLAKVIPHARRQVVEGQAHDVSPKVLAPLLLKFFSQPGL